MGVMDKLDRFQFNKLDTDAKCDHDYQRAPDLFVSGQLDQYRCTKCGDVLKR